MKSDPATILVRAPNWLGDCVMALPVFRTLRKRFPQARILAGCRRHLRACYEASPDVDGVIECPGGGVSALLTLWRESGALRRDPIDVGILLTNSFSTALWLWRSGARRRIGFARDARSVFLTDAEPTTDALLAAHQAEYYLHLCGLLGAEPTLTQPHLVVPEAGSNAAGAVLNDLSISGDYAVVAPVSAYGPVKDWPPARYAEACRRIADEWSMPVLVTGTKKDADACQSIADTAGSGVFNAAGRTDLSGFMAMIDRCALFVGGDSGGAHVAAACGKPTVAIFGITEPSRTRSLGARVRNVGKGGTATPHLSDPQVRKAAQEELERIGVDEVVGALRAASEA